MQCVMCNGKIPRRKTKMRVLCDDDEKCNLMFAVHIHNLMLKMLLFQNGNIRT